MENQIFNVGDIVKVTGSEKRSEIGKFVAVEKVTKTQCLVVFPDGSRKWINHDCLLPKIQEKVNRPSHYSQNGIECFDVIRAVLGTDGLKTFCEGNIIKYAFRMRHKGQYLYDVKKIRTYAEQIIKIQEEQ